MGFDDGRIVLDSDTGVYFAGQTVFGKLIFDQQKEKTFRGIYVKFKGFCKVHWRESRTRTRNGRTETYYVDHNSHEEYFNQRVYLIGSENGEHKIQAGHYEFQFQCMIPPNCPSSFEGTYGHIRYELKAVVDRAFKMDQEKMVAIRILAPLDLNTTPNVKDPVQFSFDKTYYCCCTSSGNVKAVVKLPYGGYVPGQNIPIEVSCNNSSSVTIDSITFTIKRKITFHAQGTKTESENIAELELGEVCANTNRTFATELLVPHEDAPNLLHCQYIDNCYKIKVTLSPDGCHSDSTQSHPLVIGTIPLLGSNYTPNPQSQNAHQNTAIVNQPLQSHYPGSNAPYGNSPYPDGTPKPSPYPGAPYPGANSPYPGANSPYPGPGVSPYPNHTNTYPEPTHNPMNNPYPPPYSETPPTNTPYPSGPVVSPYPPSNSPYPTKSPNPTSITPYPTSSAPYPAGDGPNPTSITPYPTSGSPYPATSAPYPTTNSPNPSTKAPYPATSSPYPPAPVFGNSSPAAADGPNPTSVAPYPTSDSPYPPTGAPYPATSSPYPPAPVLGNSSPFPALSAVTGLKTGTLGFMAQGGDGKSMPPLPSGTAVAYPASPMNNPYATASAPEPATPEGDEKKLP